MGFDTFSFSSLFNLPQTINLASAYSAYSVTKLSGGTLNITAPAQLTLNTDFGGGLSFTGGGVLDLGNVTITGDNFPGSTLDSASAATAAPSSPTTPFRTASPLIRAPSKSPPA